MDCVSTGIIILVLLSLIIILILKSSGNTEKFRTTKCDFTAVGDNKLDCLNKCKGNPECYHYQCEEICSKCELDKTVCPWDTPDDTLEPTINNTPQTVEIDVDTSEASVKISFKTSRLKSYDIDGYLYQLYKTNKKSDGIHMGLFANKNCITCEKVITNLDPKETYTVSVKPFNRNGMGEESNKVNFVPIGKLSNYDFNINTPIKDLFENEYKFCDSN